MVLDPWKRPYERVKDNLLTDCCLMCEEYSGDGHDYRACGECPVLVLYASYEELWVDKSWSVRPFGTCEMGSC